MTLVHRSRSYVVEDVRVLSIESRIASDENEEDIQWFATYYAPDPEATGAGETTRVLIGTLHVHGQRGWGTVTVGGLITPSSDVPDQMDEEMRQELVKDSAALETLYDLARITFKSVAGLLELHLSLPHKSPEAEVFFSDDGAEIEDDASMADGVPRLD